MTQDYRQDMQAYIQIANEFSPEDVEKAAIGMLIFLSNLAATATRHDMPAIETRYNIAQALRLAALRLQGHTMTIEDNLQQMRDAASNTKHEMDRAASDISDAADEVRSAAYEAKD